MRKRRLRKQLTANKDKSEKKEYILPLSQAFYQAMSEAVNKKCHDRT